MKRKGKGWECMALSNSFILVLQNKTYDSNKLVSLHPRVPTWHWKSSKNVDIKWEIRTYVISHIMFCEIDHSKSYGFVLH